jgi:hypothetical protein
MPWIPNCPKCQGKAEVHLNTPHIPHGAAHGAGHALQHVAKSHPAVAVVALTGLGAAALWGRYAAPKKCTRCMHVFK